MVCAIVFLIQIAKLHSKEVLLVFISMYIYTMCGVTCFPTFTNNPHFFIIAMQICEK